MDHPFEFPLVLPRRGSRQRLAVLHGQLRAAILDGRLKPGARLPATRTLAEGLDISRNTAVAAYDLLLSEGYVESRRGAGYFVAQLALRRDVGKARVDASTRDDRLVPYWRNLAQLAVSPSSGIHAHDFRLGIPDSRSFPFDVWRRLYGRALRSASKTAPLYDVAQGRLALREAIANHISFARAVSCEPRDIVVTSGAQQAFDLLARVLVTPGQTVMAVEDPGYPPLRAAFLAAGARIVGVPVDEEGLIVDKLPAEANIVYVTPSHQFPLGVVMSPRRRMALLEYARAHRALVIEDDYDSEFRYSGRPLDALQTLDRDESVCYVGTFSKCLLPTLRLGYAVVPPWLRTAFIHAKHQADCHGDVLVQDTLAVFIGEGYLVRHVRHMRKVYAERRTALLDAIKRHAVDVLQPWPSDAGLHIAARLNVPADASELHARAATIGINFDTLKGYALEERSRRGIAFGLGLIDGAKIDEAIGKLTGLLV